jgi:hypothetical protein
MASFTMPKKRIFKRTSRIVSDGPLRALVSAFDRGTCATSLWEMRMLSPPLDILRRSLKLSGENNLPAAIELLNEGVALCEADPEHRPVLPRLVSSLGLFYRRMDRHDEAMSAVRRALVMFPEDRSLLHFLADLLIESGDPRAAALVAMDLRAACERHPETFSADWAEALTLLENRIVNAMPA